MFGVFHVYGESPKWLVYNGTSILGNLHLTTLPILFRHQAIHPIPDPCVSDLGGTLHQCHQQLWNDTPMKHIYELMIM